MCKGGCPYDSFCDSGICRCYEGYEERYGTCWAKVRDFTRIDWGKRLSVSFDPFPNCTEHRTCTSVDMNMICGGIQEKTDENSMDHRETRCKCRENMEWNPDVLECQLFIDVNCSSDNNIENASQNQTLNPISLPSKPSSTILRKYQISLRNRPLSYLSPLVTLERSMLLNLDLTKTKSAFAKSIFCRELTTISRRYGILKRKRLIKQQISSKKQSSYVASSKHKSIVNDTFVITLLQIIIICSSKIMVFQ